MIARLRALWCWLVGHDYYSIENPVWGDRHRPCATCGQLLDLDAREWDRQCSEVPESAWHTRDRIEFEELVWRNLR